MARQTTAMATVCQVGISRRRARPLRRKTLTIRPMPGPGGAGPTGGRGAGALWGREGFPPVWGRGRSPARVCAPAAKRRLLVGGLGGIDLHLDAAVLGVVVRVGGV